MNITANFSKPQGRYSNNVISSIRMNCAKNREMPALICEDRTVSWEQMWDRTARLGNGWMDLGMTKGDRLAIYLKNSIEFSETFISTYHSGVIKTAVSSGLKAAELTHQLNNCGARAVVTSPELLDVLNAAKPDLPALKHIIVTGDQVPKEYISYEQLIRDSSPADRGLEVSPYDIDMLLDLVK